MSEASPPYPPVDPRPDYPALEREILAYWESDGTFPASVESRPAGERGENEYVFYDGPPFANGLPHTAHLLTGYAKDVIPRYQTMRGRRVERRFGWDCHGLPAEMEAEKELGVSGRTAIEAYGIARFNAHCRTSVLRYTKEWERFVTRQARWVDFSNDYKTLDLPYMESVIWAFKRLWDQGLVYEGYRVLPYSWACETPLSNFEIRLDDATRPRQSPAITVALRLESRPGDPGPMDLLVWTTTPWTVPVNLAAAVDPELDYALLAQEGRVYVVAESRVAAYERELGGAERAGSVKGSGLLGRRYEPPFPFLRDHPNAHRVLAADFIETGEGTGAVHLAPHGVEDQQVLEAAGIQLVDLVDERGRFTEAVPPYAGLNVFDANPQIVRDLKSSGALLRHETIVHNYPHCWRTDTPIIYKPLRSWYVRVTAIRDRMLQLNQEIRWVPEHIRDGQFGKWLEGARDWCVSRNRFFGSPIPVWKSDDPAFPRLDVYGSLDELARDFGRRPGDLHRPAVDDLVRKNPDDPTGRSVMRRVPEVLDCWFESGSMPFAQVHYPFENREWFEQHFPADYIVEYVAQTRGWFYTLMVLGTALFDKPPFRSCLCHGVLLDRQGRKLSKRLRNYADPVEVFERYGADALRWYLISSPLLRGGDVRLDESGEAIGDVVRLVLNPLWNAYVFFTLYANVDGYRARERKDSDDLLDRYVLARTRSLIESVGSSLDALDMTGACQHVTSFLDALNNWYIRRSRGRFWAEGLPADKQAAYDTLYTVLTALCRTTAPLLPLLTEGIYRGLTGARSVHLTDWPAAQDFPAAPSLVAEMERVREVCGAALSLREEHGLRARLPLQRLVVAGREAGSLAPYAGLIAEEVNVKAVEFEKDLQPYGRYLLRVDRRQLGPRLGSKMAAVLQAAREGNWSLESDGTCLVADERLDPALFELALEPHADLVSRPLPGNALIVVLDVAVTEELRREGIARDLIRIIQQARKDAGLEVTDRIDVRLNGSGGPLGEALERHGEQVSSQVLARSLSFGKREEDMQPFEGRIEGERVQGALRRVRS